MCVLSSIAEEKGLADIDLLKVDVEGAELEVLYGVRAAQWTRIHQVVLEVENFANKDAVCELLSAKGFACHWFPSERERNKNVLSEVCCIDWTR